VFDPIADDYEMPRRLLLHEMTANELRQEVERHRLFEKRVGNLMYCWHLPPDKRRRALRPGRERFYEEAKRWPAIDYENRGPTGWFRPVD
jgi:hypothetical protein